MEPTYTLADLQTVALERGLYGSSRVYVRVNDVLRRVSSAEIDEDGDLIVEIVSEADMFGLRG